MTESTDATVVGPLPESGPATLGGVKAYLSIGDANDDAQITDVVAAVNDKVRGFAVADRARGLDEWPASIVLGANMLGGRLHKRRGSPDGLAAFGDMGAVYVSRNDPDVAMLLELGSYQRPAVG